MDATLTDAELARMILGWPKEARPALAFDLNDELPIAVLVETGDVWGDDGLPLAHAIDLACMAGMRWLSQQKPPDDYYTRVYRVEFWTSPDGGSVVRLSWTTDGGMGTREEHRDSLGPTILHAIDAAIRASK